MSVSDRGDVTTNHGSFKDKPIDIMILTSYFARDPNEILGGVGYRYVGLYGSLAASLLSRSPHSRVFWYSSRDRCMRRLSGGSVVPVTLSMLMAIRKVIDDAGESGHNVAAIIAYPSVVSGSRRHLLDFMLALIYLKFPHKARVMTYVDDFDPPVEASMAFQERPPSRLRVALLRMLDLCVLRSSTFVIALSDFWKNLFILTYGLKPSSIVIVSNGCLLRQIRYVESSSPNIEHKPVNILYAGSAMKVKDVDRLIDVVHGLRMKGLRLDLSICGAKLMDTPDWVQIKSYDWLTMARQVLPSSDICVIPYPSNRVTFSHGLPAKLFDYMGAGKPVVSTNLEGTGLLLKRYNCGLVAENWQDFSDCIERIYNDPQLAKRLGANGRRAAEEFFDYERIAEHLLDQIASAFG